MHLLLNAPLQDVSLALGQWAKDENVTLLPDYNFAKSIVTVHGNRAISTVLVLLADVGITARQLSNI